MQIRYIYSKYIDNIIYATICTTSTTTNLFNATVKNPNLHENIVVTMGLHLVCRPTYQQNI